MTGDEDGEHWGAIHDVRGLFAAQAAEDLLEVEFVGCHLQGKLSDCLDSLPVGGVQLGGAALDVLDSNGVSMGSYFVYEMTVAAARPSSPDSRLVDLSVTLYCDNAHYGGEWVWNLIRDGRLNRRDIWRGLDTVDRTAWLAVALWTSAYQRRGRPDSAPGHVFTLDGQAVTDIASFYCALGEAINGPGGYFGWNLDALWDCLRGGWGASSPFTLEWLHSDVAQEHLLTHSAVAAGQTLFDLLLEIFDDKGIEVILR
ncbi:barstar family protein [Nocardia goodfellowii]|uniref:RNAse (Barnase) inhibitor barstar n=1 Tax=Nocardia goodfellowii TaxID=882446 RepID=A0ABS4QNB4_9NOCA|nr:barstar family protein [Nocardia goodfellowii]MBP2192563.1 RNAse (barnase) inhibitor barstar [Nocardia goodfellowii]